MTLTAGAAPGRAERAGRVDKFAARRDELAEAALATLAELGYARTSLREIAANTAFSHGVLHYYFTDKMDLITHCVKHYKTACVRRYDEIIEIATDAEGLAVAFGGAMAATASADAPLHRLWYDMRSQSMFEPALRADVLDIDASLEAMIWRVVTRYAELRGGGVSVAPSTAYAVLDGVFQQALLHHLAGSAGALDALEVQVVELLPKLVSRRIDADHAVDVIKPAG